MPPLGAFFEESRVSILPIEDCTEVERNAIEGKRLRGPSDVRRSVLRYTSLAGPELPAPPRVAVTHGSPSNIASKRLPKQIIGQTESGEG